MTFLLHWLAHRSTVQHCSVNPTGQRLLLFTRIQVGGTLENTRGGSLLGYHSFIERDKAGPVLSIKWVPPMVLKTNKDIIEKVASLPQNYEMQTWETLILDAEALLPDVRGSLVLAFSALETLIAIALDYFVTTTPTPPELWKWVNKRDFWLKEPSVEERYTVLLKILTNKSLKDDPALWQSFVDLRKARNSIAHTGKPTLNRREINPEQARLLIGGAKNIINWIEQLLPEIMRRPIYATQTNINIVKPIA